MTVEHFKTSLQIRAAIFIVVLFLGSAWASCREVKYLVWGETADVEIVRVQEATVRESRFQTRKVQSVRYRWTDAEGVTREDSMRFSMDWQLPADGKLRVDYLLGVKDSRLHGERNVTALLVFFVMLAAAILAVARIVWQAYE